VVVKFVEGDTKENKTEVYIGRYWSLHSVTPKFIQADTEVYKVDTTEVYTE